jgi:hypothetical protein
VESTTQGFLPPRLSEEQILSIEFPVNGLMVFNTTTGCINYYFNEDWLENCGTKQCLPSSVTFSYNDSLVTYGVVYSSGRCWLDRNLGASRVAESILDTASYGDLFQWGRLDDGHQVRDPLSGTTNTLSNSDQPGHGDFIITNDSNFDWRSPQNPNLWQGTDGINNPCPQGFRMPTTEEWLAERDTWISMDSEGAFLSPLKLTLAGERSGLGGNLLNVGTGGHYWSSTVGGSSSNHIQFDSFNAVITNFFRAWGRSVRCIRD